MNVYNKAPRIKQLKAIFSRNISPSIVISLLQAHYFPIFPFLFCSFSNWKQQVRNISVAMKIFREKLICWASIKFVTTLIPSYLNIYLCLSRVQRPKADDITCQNIFSDKVNPKKPVCYLMPVFKCIYLFKIVLILRQIFIPCLFSPGYISYI